MTLNSMPKASAFWMILFSVVLAYSPAATAQVSTSMGTDTLGKQVSAFTALAAGVGNWGTDYALRAMGNMLGPGWNRPQDAMYPLSQKDANGDDYNGAEHKYEIHFDKGQFPPVKAFWSITLYDPDFFFAPNSINHYELSQRNKFITNPDGSVDMYLQADSPGKAKEANWQPAPKGKFVLVMRLYWPTTTPPSILDGSWKPPAATRAK